MGEIFCHRCSTYSTNESIHYIEEVLEISIDINRHRDLMWGIGPAGVESMILKLHIELSALWALHKALVASLILSQN